MAVSTETKPAVGKGVICDYCLNQLSGEEYEPFPCTRVRTVGGHPSYPSLDLTNDARENCDDFIHIVPLKDMLRTVNDIFGEDGGEESGDLESLAKKVAIDLGYSYIGFWEHQRQGLREAFHHEIDTRNFLWRSSISKAQEGNWRLLKMDIGAQGRELLDFKTDYPIGGVPGDQFEIKGLDENWEKFGNSLKRLAALLPSE